jgi:RNA polymerase sigma factor (sigma-70 family)
VITDDDKIAEDDLSMVLKYWKSSKPQPQADVLAIEAALNMICRKAKQMARGQRDAEAELMQEGLMALMEAMHKYPIFSSQFYEEEEEAAIPPFDIFISEYINATMSTVARSSLIRRKNRSFDDFSQSREDLSSILSGKVMSWELSGERSNLSRLLRDCLIDSDELSPESQALQTMIRSDIKQVFNLVLNDVERQVIYLYFGFENEERHLKSFASFSGRSSTLVASQSWKMIAQQCKTTPQFVQLIANQALTKLRDYALQRNVHGSK